MARALRAAFTRSMNFQQLRSVRETVRQGFNLTLVADAPHKSQPGVSRQLKDLETELGIELFVRAGRRLLGLTPPGQALLPIIEQLLQEAENLRRAGAEFAQAGRGLLTLAATHTQARYALPSAVRDFRDAHPQVTLHLQQGSPRQIAEMVLAGQSDLGIATEALAEYPDFAALPCHRWTHLVLVAASHPLAEEMRRGGPLSLARLAQFPLVTCEAGYTGRSHMDEALARGRLRADVVLSAMDADAIKTCVGLGIGAGVIASMAFDEARDGDLVAIDARHLFATNTTRVAVGRGAWLRGDVFDFVNTFAPTMTRAVVEQALASAPGEEFEVWATVSNPKTPTRSAVRARPHAGGAEQAAHFSVVCAAATKAAHWYGPAARSFATRSRATWPSLKMTLPHSPRARARASAQPVSSVRIGKITLPKACQRLAPIWRLRPVVPSAACGACCGKRMSSCVLLPLSSQGSGIVSRREPDNQTRPPVRATSHANRPLRKTP
jgi:LysR family cys regulon transcriptional activator